MNEREIDNRVDTFVKKAKTIFFWLNNDLQSEWLCHLIQTKAYDEMDRFNLPKFFRVHFASLSSRSIEMTYANMLTCPEKVRELQFGYQMRQRFM